MAAQLIYSGLVGEQSYALIEYLEAVPGVQPIKAGENPATWMLEVTGGRLSHRQEQGRQG